MLGLTSYVAVVLMRDYGMPPLVAAGAAVLATGLVVSQLRLGDDLSPGVALVVIGAATGALLVLGLRTATEPTALLVTGIVLLADALVQLADVAGADLEGGVPAGTLTWTGLVTAGVAAYAARRSGSAACLLLAAIAAGVALLSALEWIFDPNGFAAGRWLLVVLALALAAASVRLRGRSPRHAELLVDAAGLAILVIGVQALWRGLLAALLVGGSFDGLLPGFWELVVLAGACGLIAYAVVYRVPGPAWLAVANLAVFAVLAGPGFERTLYWWPMLLVVGGAAALLAGLGLAPLPAGERPRAARASDDEELVLRVRDDSPPAGTVPER